MMRRDDRVQEAEGLRQGFLIGFPHHPSTRPVGCNNGLFGSLHDLPGLAPVMQKLACSLAPGIRENRSYPVSLARAVPGKRTSEHAQRKMLFHPGNQSPAVQRLIRQKHQPN